VTAAEPRLALGYLWPLVAVPRRPTISLTLTLRPIAIPRLLASPHPEAVALAGPACRPQALPYLWPLAILPGRAARPVPRPLAVHPLLAHCAATRSLLQGRLVSRSLLLHDLTPRRRPGRDVDIRMPKGWAPGQPQGPATAATMRRRERRLRRRLPPTPPAAPPPPPASSPPITTRPSPHRSSIDSVCEYEPPPQTGCWVCGLGVQHCCPSPPLGTLCWFCEVPLVIVTSTGMRNNGLPACSMCDHRNKDFDYRYK
jgi:hypothetical protein